MSLFPAYAGENEPPPSLAVLADIENTQSAQTLISSGQHLDVDFESGDSSSPLDDSLLDTEDESPPHAPSPVAATPPSPAPCYEERRGDRGHLRVSTLYYPARPDYLAPRPPRSRAPRRRRRYHARPLPPTDDRADYSTSHDALQRRLRDRPHDLQLWLQYVQFQRTHADDAAALAAVEAAVARLDALPLRLERLEAARRALPHHRALEELRAALAVEREPAARRAVWVRLLAEAACGPGAPPDGLAAAALADTRRDPAAAPRLLRMVFTLLRLGGHSERLTLLLELTLALNFAPHAVKPPQLDPEAETTLVAFEDKVCSSGLPLWAVWSRVERARAAAHWAPGCPDLDPQRAPSPSDLAELLCPVTSRDGLLRLAAAVLHALDVPVLPGGGWVRRALLGPPPHPPAERAESAGDLLQLLSAAPPRSPADRAAARALLAVAADPPHYLDDEHGYLSWTCAVWGALCGWARAEERDALLCWRIRWHEALLSLAADGERGTAERARVRRAAKAALRSSPPESPLPYAELAHLDGDAAAGRRALRATIAADDVPHSHVLYAARLAADTAEAAGQAAAARWALVCAVLRRPLPPDDPPADPPIALLEAARALCEERCADLEVDERYLLPEEEGEGELLSALLLPGAGEWLAVRALLVARPRLAEICARLCGGSAGGGRLHEEACVAVVRALRGVAALKAARTLLPMHPDNPLLAVLSGRCPAWVQCGAHVPDTAGAARLGGALPALLRGDAGRALSRAGPHAGALLAALRVESSGGAAVALVAAPYAKWVAVRAAGHCPHAEDVLLDRLMRLHALPDELAV